MCEDDPTEQPDCGTKRQRAAAVTRLDEAGKWCLRPSKVPRKEPPLTGLADETRHEETPSFNALPRELFYQIISYLGPTSPSIPRLAQLSRHYRSEMETIGAAMLDRARTCGVLCFPVPPLTGWSGDPKHIRSFPSSSLSSIARFVCHAHCCKDVYDHFTELGTLVDKKGLAIFCPGATIHFKGINTETGYISKNKALSWSAPLSVYPLDNAARAPQPSSETEGTCSNNSTYAKNIEERFITAEEIDYSVSLALRLLGAATFTTSGSATQIGKGLGNGKILSLGHCSASLVKKVLALCGRWGGKILIYTKMRLALRNRGAILYDSSHHTKAAVVDDSTISQQQQQMARKNDQERLHNVRLLMLLVVVWDFALRQMVVTTPSGISVRGSAVVNDFDSNTRGSGCTLDIAN